MKKTFIATILFVFLAVLFAGTPFSFADAEIKNNSNTMVAITIHKTNGRVEPYDLFPGQAIDLPEDAMKVKLEKSPFQLRGDEEIEVEVTGASGDSGTLKRFGHALLIPQDEPTETALK